MKKRPFIIDCDTGTDDAIALVAALGCPEMEIVGITSVNGNVAEKYTSQNNLDIMEYLGCDIPVCHGAFLPLAANRETAAGAGVHGKSGLGNVELPKASRTDFDRRMAAEFIYDKALEYDGELEILASGPLTNIAIACLEHPQLGDYIRRIYFMGGAMHEGNVTTSAEYNIWVDPEACHTLMMSQIPLTMVGLNVSNQALMGAEEEQLIRSYQTRESALVADLLLYHTSREHPYEFARMHDPLALASCIYPDCLKFKEYFVDAEIRGKYTRGHTAVDIRGRYKERANVSVAVELDLPLFKKWLCEKVKAAGEIGEERRKGQ